MTGNGQKRSWLRNLARKAVQGRKLHVEKLSSEDLRILVHELGVYQVELEVQNEELREATDLLQEARDRYRELYEFAPVGYLTLNADGIIQQANREGVRILGVPHTRLIGRELTALLAEQSAAALQQVLAENQPQTLEIRTRNDSDQRYMRLDLAPHRSGDQHEFRVTMVDVTATRRAETALDQSEKRLRTLADTAPLGIFEIDSNGRITYVNNRWTIITGLSAEKSFDFGWTAAIHPEERQRIVSEWAGRIGEEPWVQEFRLLRPNGSEGWARMVSAPSEMEDGRPGSYVGILEDITLERQAQQQRQAREAAEEANRTKSEFLANMSHEIRTPLTIALGALGVLKDSNLNDEQVQLLEMTENASRSLLGLIEDILDFSKIEARKRDLHPQICAVAPCLDKVVRMFSLEAENKGLELVAEVAPEVPEAVWLDPDCIHQILTNLIGNAVKFTEKGRIALNVATAEGCLRFCVSDTGIGIPSAQLDRLFESFTQADGSVTRKYGGTGLGLAISKGLVELMGGTIWAQSREGEGCDFYFTVPLAEGATEAGGTPPGEGGCGEQ